MGERIATNFVATNANKARTTRARRSKLSAGQMKGKTRFKVRLAALPSVSIDAWLGLTDTRVEPSFNNQDVSVVETGR